MTNIEYTKIPLDYRQRFNNIYSPEYVKEHYGGDVMKACEQHPALFSYYFFDIKLRYYQLYMIDQMLNEKYVFSAWGRRMGKSTVFKLFATWAIFYNKYPTGTDKTTKVVVLAHTQDGADSYIEDTNLMFEIGDKIVEKRFKGQLGPRFFTSHLPNKGSKVANNRKQLSFYRNGWNTIKSYPPTTSARGIPASIMILDEIAFWCDYTSLVKDDYDIYSEVVRPIPTDQPDSRIFIATTPNGASGLAYDLMPVDNHKTIYKLIWFPYYYRDDEAYLNSMKETEQEYADQGREASFRQEYLAELVSRTDSYFDKNTEVDKVFDDKKPMLPSYSGECELGLDFGGSKKSRTVITISRYDEKNNTVERIYHKRYPVREDSTLKEDIIDIVRRFPNIVKFHIDDQGGGSSFYGWFKNTFGSATIDEVSFRREKADMYRLFKIACFQDRVKSYIDQELLDEFNGFTADLKPSKHSTDDMLDSFVMSVKDHLVVEEHKTNYGVVSY